MIDDFEAHILSVAVKGGFVLRKLSSEGYSLFDAHGNGFVGTLDEVAEWLFDEEVARLAERGHCTRH